MTGGFFPPTHIALHCTDKSFRGGEGEVGIFAVVVLCLSPVLHREK